MSKKDRKNKVVNNEVIEEVKTEEIVTIEEEAPVVNDVEKENTVVENKVEEVTKKETTVKVKEAVKPIIKKKKAIYDF